MHAWIDMNEPSVFESKDGTFPKANIHLLDNEELVENRAIHNIFGVLSSKATYEGMLERNPDQNLRPFLLSRSFYAGSQKYGAFWTGDNSAVQSDMLGSIPMLLSLSLSGISFVGADIGGFFGDPTPELYMVWMFLGSFQPFMRIHSHHETKNREVYRFLD